jgi:hypothetical protein
MQQVNSVGRLLDLAQRIDGCTDDLRLAVIASSSIINKQNKRDPFPS